MSKLPITHLTLYKHGVGFFQRSARIQAEQVKLLFRASEMNDILKSLTVIDSGKGKVLGIDYATPQTREELLEGCSINLGPGRSLRDMLADLRGRHVALWLKANEGVRGLLLGMDELPDRQPAGTALVSILLEESSVVRTVELHEIQGVELLDEQSANDLKFFLQTALTQEEYRQVTLRLTPGEHNLTVSYIAPAPTWRVSYRLVSAGEGEKASTLLQGWGIFDNRLEEDLEKISLSLVAGRPISFIYDLYTPFMPDRPVIEEEDRSIPGPVEFESQSLEAPLGFSEGMPSRSYAPSTPAPMMARRAAMKTEDLVASTAVETSSKSLGELFEYRINTPVSVGRGQSAMAPVVSALLTKKKDLLYNGSKLDQHPVATLRLRNTSGLTLERGPVTVLEDGEYVGEAILPFTPADGEIVVPYAVELGAKINEYSGTRYETHTLRLHGAMLYIEQWEILWRDYRAANTTNHPLTVLIEHPRHTEYELFESQKEAEKTAQYFRFTVQIPAQGEEILHVQERRQVSRKEELKKQSYEQLRRFVRQGLIKPEVFEEAAKILQLWEEIENQQRRLTALGAEREAVYRQQKQIQSNMGSLGKEGKEGALRARYVDELDASEAMLKRIGADETSVHDQIAALEEKVAQQVKSLE